MAVGHFLDGKASLVVGTHTHVPTNDARILSGGTAYMTDAGMCGDYDSVIGMDKINSINRFLKEDSKKQIDLKANSIKTDSTKLKVNDEEKVKDKKQLENKIEETKADSTANTNDN